MDFQKRSRLLITCAPGLSEWLQKEIEALGHNALLVRKTGIEIEGTLADSMQLNLWLRTAFAVLYLLDEFECPDAEALYRATVKLPWEDIIPVDEYISIVSHVDNPTINNSMFPNLKLKDAIVDRIMKKEHRRPDSGPERTNIVVNLYWKDDRAWLYLNTSGNKLADRGYRRIPHKAPMQETLAAAVIMATGYTGETPLPPAPFIVVMNPEYGKRMGEISQLEKVYERIGDFFKQKCQGLTGYVFTGNLDLAKKVHLTPSRKFPFFNADIDCRLLKYEMYAGSRRKDRNPGPAEIQGS